MENRMSKFAKDIKVNNIIWTISEGDKPQLLPLIVTNINIRKLLWTGYYDLTLRLPNGSEKFISLFDTGERRDYYVPFLTDLFDDLKDYAHDNAITIMASFDKDKLWNQYVNGLKQSIDTVKEVIEKGQQNLKELNKKLNYIEKQYDNIQEG
jgi:hypothetical protein